MVFSVTANNEWLGVPLMHSQVPPVRDSVFVVSSTWRVHRWSIYSLRTIMPEVAAYLLYPASVVDILGSIVCPHILRILHECNFSFSKCSMCCSITSQIRVVVNDLETS